MLNFYFSLLLIVKLHNTPLNSMVFSACITNFFERRTELVSLQYGTN